MADPTTPDTRLTLTRIIEVALHEELSKYSNLSAMALRSRDVSRRLADAVVAAPELLQLADESSRLREALKYECDHAWLSDMAEEPCKYGDSCPSESENGRCDCCHAKATVARLRAALAPPKERT